MSSINRSGLCRRGDVLTLLETRESGLLTASRRSGARFSVRMSLKKEAAYRPENFSPAVSKPFDFYSGDRRFYNRVSEPAEGRCFYFYRRRHQQRSWFYQENKAEKALESLRAYVKEKARVTRGGLEKKLTPKSLSPATSLI